MSHPNGQRIEIDADLAGQRLDVIVTRSTELGRAGVRRLFAEGRVVLTQAGRRLRVRKGDAAVAGTVIELLVTDDLTRAAPDDTLPLQVVHEADTFVVVHKPAGVASAPIRPGERGAVANALVARYPETANIGFSLREPGLCHRLDWHTSGLLLAARTEAAFEELTGAIRSGRFDKRYLLICQAAPLQESGTIDGSVLTEGPKVQLHADGRPAVTRYRIAERHGDLALVEASASPAARHQIRVHFASLGAPLLGDATYGGDTTVLTDRHALHASRLAYAGGDAVPAFAFDAPLPDDLRAVLSAPTE